MCRNYILSYVCAYSAPTILHSRARLIKEHVQARKSRSRQLYSATPKNITKCRGSYSDSILHTGCVWRAKRFTFTWQFKKFKVKKNVFTF